MKKQIFIAIIMIFWFKSALYAQNTIPKQLIGTWESVQLRAAYKDSLDEKIIYAISPRVLYIDSSGNFHIELFYEAASWKGKITSVKKTDREIVLKYCAKNYCMEVKTVGNNSDYIFLSYPGVYNSFLFRKF